MGSLTLQDCLNAAAVITWMNKAADSAAKLAEEIDDKNVAAIRESQQAMLDAFAEAESAFAKAPAVFDSFPPESNLGRSWYEVWKNARNYRDMMVRVADIAVELIEGEKE